ncbi:MAG: hypothetical protein AB7H48_07280 [Parachlamydiales bacterium]
MQVKIENERVRKNVELFLHILNMLITAELGKSLHQRVYKAYINRVNGEVLFTDLLPDPSVLNKKDWKVVLLQCEEQEGKVSFNVVEGEGSQACFNCEELAPLAYKTVAETIHKLNECAQLVTKAAAPDKLLEDLSQLLIEPSSLKPPYDLIQACWHPLDRISAEELLFKHPYGSFFFRKDEYAQWLEEMLADKHPEPIKCFTLTLIEPERKVSDLTIVFINDRCLIYNDDPSLAGNVYPDLTALLQSLKERCKYPVFH